MKDQMKKEISRRLHKFAVKATRESIFLKERLGLRDLKAIELGHIARQVEEWSKEIAGEIV